MNKELRAEIKYIRGMALTLNILADEIESMKRIDSESEELYRKVGSDILFHAVTVSWLSEEL